MQEYNICYSLDTNYVEQFSVSVASILKNASDNDNIKLYILDGGLSKKDKTNIEILKNIKNFSVEYLKIDKKEFANCPILSKKSAKHKNYHVTLPTYFRFKLPDLLKNLDKVLYLDCDVIVRTSLKELYEIPFEDNAVLMIKDVESKKEAKRLDIKNYFNAGVMLINLDYWRKNNVSNLLFEYAKNNQDKILWQDQDIINVVLNGKIKNIDIKWNFQYFLFEKLDENLLQDCCILHLAGRFKPWLMPFEHFVYDSYYFYLLLTPYKNRFLDYRQKSSGKFLKNNIGGSVTNILNVASDFDIQKVYEEITKNYEYTNNLSKQNEQKIEQIDNEIVEKISDAHSVTDEKIAKVYEEITKNYEYTNNLSKQNEQKIEQIDNEFVEKISDVHSVTDEKIAKVYEEITKNYEYTNDLSKQNEQKIEQIDNEIVEKISDAHSVTDEKIAKVYEEITKNYEYTNNLSKQNEQKIEQIDNEIVEKISDVHSVTDEKIAKVYEEITKNYEYTNDLSKQNEQKIEQIDNEIVEKISDAHSVTDEKIGKVYEEITKNYEYTNDIKDVLFTEISQKENVLNEKLILVEKNLLSEIDDSLLDFKNEIQCLYDKVVLNDENLRRDFEELKQIFLEKLNFYQNQIIEKLSDEINQKIDSVHNITDEKIRKVYEEITKNYEYTNDLSKQNEQKIEQIDNEIVEKISDVHSVTDEKIAKVYEEITKNYEYTNNLSKQNEQKIEQIDNEIVEKISDVHNITDKKIGRVYDEITKNYEYTNEIRDSLNEKINQKINENVEMIDKENKDLVNSVKLEISENIVKTKSELQENIGSVKDEIQNKISNLEEVQNRKNDLQFSQVYSYANNELTKIFEQVNQNNNNLENKIEYKAQEIYKDIWKEGQRVSNVEQTLFDKANYSDIASLEKSFEEKLKALNSANEKQLADLISDFENQLNEQRIKYEKKLISMENTIFDLEQKYTESRKNFFVKVIEKCVKR